MKPEPTAQTDAFDTTGAPPAEVAAIPEAAKEVQDSHGVIAAARALKVTNPAEYTAAANMLQELRGTFGRLEKQRKAITDPMNAAKERVMAFFRGPTEAVEAAGKLLRDKINAYDAEQKRIADEARRKAEAEAERQRKEAEAKARAEREAAEAEARKKREEAERQRQEQEAAERRAREQREAEERAAREAEEARRRGDAEAARKAQEAEATAKAAREAEEKAAREAASAAARNDRSADRVEAKGEEKAQQLEVQAASVVAPVIESGTTKVAGIARRMVWKYKVKDEAAVKREFLALDDAKIARIVKAMGKDAETMVGGIECWQENDISARAK